MRGRRGGSSRQCDSRRFPPSEVAAACLLAVLALRLWFSPRDQRAPVAVGVAVVAWAVWGLAGGTLVSQACPWSGEEVVRRRGLHAVRRVSCRVHARVLG